MAGLQGSQGTGTAQVACALAPPFRPAQFERSPGWDRRVEHALVVVAGDSDLDRGRRLLARIAPAEQERRDARPI